MIMMTLSGRPTSEPRRSRDSFQVSIFTQRYRKAENFKSSLRLHLLARHPRSSRATPPLGRGGLAIGDRCDDFTPSRLISPQNPKAKPHAQSSLHRAVMEKLKVQGALRDLRKDPSLG
ncbi:hypothetical protein BOTBODRAFT_211825 [Botryobasidium botryosum FD-172 SS1]|uniref:Uncharacterized protein n=1 Tax=Botryobasidium botryosum (strain FD-172 SS1) TaxID=930990 RepID=A0A067N419_BOTB1|nr:hypothetical protein BOTBODRAFT_211825 [Botryobasidium botryosum FD-172 SS1]